LRRPQTDLALPTSGRLYRYFQKPGILMLGSFLLFPFLFSFSRRLSSLPFSCHPFILSTAGGLPPPDYFPYETLTATTLARNSFRTTEQGLGAWLWSFVAGGKKTDKWDIAKWESDPLKVQLSSALQYGASISFPPFRRTTNNSRSLVVLPCFSLPPHDFSVSSQHFSSFDADLLPFSPP
jgi:hypothetical protein